MDKKSIKVRNHLLKIEKKREYKKEREKKHIKRTTFRVLNTLKTLNQGRHKKNKKCNKQKKKKTMELYLKKPREKEGA